MTVMDAAIATESQEELAGQREENRGELLERFVETSPAYYREQFAKIGASAKFVWTFNLAAALLGPIWYGMRSLWKWGLPFVILETFGFIQIARGLFGDLGADARERIAQIQGTLDFRYQQLEAAIKREADNVDVFKRTIASLEQAIADIQAEAAAAEANAIWIALFGLGFLLVVKLAEGIMANPALENRFSQWLSDRSLNAGLSPFRTAISAGFVFIIFAVSIVHFAFPGLVGWLADFPTDQSIRLTAISWVEAFFEFIRSSGQWLFEFISYGIRVVLDALEVSVRADALAGDRQFHHSADLAVGGQRGRRRGGRVPRLYGISRFLGKSDDDAGAARHGGMYLHRAGYTARPVLRPPSALLRRHPADHGLHADHAVLRFHDSRSSRSSRSASRRR